MSHAALVLDGDRCLGWCQFGRPDEVPRIKNRKEYERERATPPDWRIACCYVGKGHRRQGVAGAALATEALSTKRMDRGTRMGTPRNGA